MARGLFPWVSLAFVLGAACSDRTLTIELVRVAPAADPTCGAPADARTIVVTALGDFPASRVISDGGPIAQGVFTLSGLDVDTRVLWVNVIGDLGLTTVGKTGVLAFDELDDGDRVPVFMAPPEGMCPTGPPNRARAQPLVARAGSGALIAGGIGVDGRSALTVERYDPGTGAFEEIAESLYGQQFHGLLGATMTTLPASDGTPERVVIAGGASPGYQVYDTATGEFSREFLLDQGRAHHAALALDGHRVMLAAGCGLPLDDDDPGQCLPLQLRSSITIIDITTGQTRDLDVLLSRRIDPILVRESDSTALLLGGVDDAGNPVTDIERIHLDGSPGEIVASAGGIATGLAGGGVVTGFAPMGADPAAGAFALPPAAGGASGPIAVGDAPSARAGVTMTPLQDGRILVFGGEMSEPGEPAMLYEPNRGQFRVLETSGRAVRQHGAVRLEDGSVLIVGGRAEGPALAEAWIFRPDLTGPYTRDISIAFGDENQELLQQVIPSNPAQARFVPSQASGEVAYYEITASRADVDAPPEWAVIAGPRFSRAAIRLDARVTGGVVVMLGFRDPHNHALVRLMPGEAPRLVVVELGEHRAIAGCDAAVVTAAQVGEGAPARIEIDRVATGLTATIGGEQVLACGGLDAPAIGLVGVGVIGEPGSTVRLDALTVRRR